MHITERSRTHRLLAPSDWGFDSGGVIGCGISYDGRNARHSCRSVTTSRVGFFEVEDVSEQWSELLPDHLSAAQE